MDPDGATLLASFSSALKHRNCNLRTLLSVGTTTADGGVTCSPPWCSSPWPASRAMLGATAVALVRDNGFDELHVVWRFPASAIEMADLDFFVSDSLSGVPPRRPGSCSPPRPTSTATSSPLRAQAWTTHPRTSRAA
jgi:chitinase